MAGSTPSKNAADLDGFTEATLGLLIDLQEGALDRYSRRPSDLTAWTESFAQEQPTTKCLGCVMWPTGTPGPAKPPPAPSSTSCRGRRPHPSAPLRPRIFEFLDRLATILSSSPDTPHGPGSPTRGATGADTGYRPLPAIQVGRSSGSDR